MADSELSVVCSSELVPSKRMMSLKTLPDLTRFGQKVINLVAKGEMPPEIGSRLFYMINIQSGVIRDGRVLDREDAILQEYVGRIAALEGVTL